MKKIFGRIIEFIRANLIPLLLMIVSIAALISMIQNRMGNTRDSAPPLSLSEAQGPLPPPSVASTNGSGGSANVTIASGNTATHYTSNSVTSNVDRTINVSFNLNFGSGDSSNGKNLNEDKKSTTFNPTNQVRILTVREDYHLNPPTYEKYGSIGPKSHCEFIFPVSDRKLTVIPMPARGSHPEKTEAYYKATSPSGEVQWVPAREYKRAQHGPATSMLVINSGDTAYEIDFVVTPHNDP